MGIYVFFLHYLYQHIPITERLCDSVQTFNSEMP